LKRSRIVANIVGPMLFIQVILGGSSTVLGVPILLHLVWGVVTFAVLIAATAMSLRDYGRRSSIAKVRIAATVIFILQGILGLISFDSDVAIVVHLANAFVLGILVTYMISFADSLDKRPVAPQPSAPIAS